MDAQWLIAVPAVVAGAAVQATSGFGFSLSTLPFLVLAFGTREGNGLTNVLTTLNNLIVLARTWRDVNPRVVVRFVPSAGLVFPSAIWPLVV